MVYAVITTTAPQTGGAKQKRVQRNRPGEKLNYIGIIARARACGRGKMVAKEIPSPGRGRRRTRRSRRRWRDGLGDNDRDDNDAGDERE